MSAKRFNEELRAKLQLSDTIHGLFERRLIGRRALNACRRLGLMFVRDIVDFVSRNENHKDLPHCGPKTTIELRSLVNMVDKDSPMPYREDSKWLKRELSDTKRKMIRKRYAELINASPTIVANFAKSHYPTYFEAADCPAMSVDEFTAIHGGKRKSSSGFYTTILEPMREYAREIAKMDETSATHARVNFPFLSEKGSSFVATYHEATGSFPMFHVIYDYILGHSGRDARMFCMKHGIDVDKTRHDMDVIAARFNLTRERARQITSSPSFLDDIDSYVRAESHLAPYKEPGASVCFPKSKWFTTLVRREHLPEIFPLFAEIYCHYFEYHICNSYNRCYIVSPSAELAVGRIVSALEQYRKAKHRVSLLIKVKDLIEKSGVPSADREQMEILVAKVIAPALDITVNGENIVFEKNACNVEQEAIEFLRSKGKPVHISEIIEKIRTDNPELTVKDTTIKFILQHSDKIASIGKTSCYALREWTHVYIGGIRDAVRQCLRNSDKPVDINEIVAFVLSRHPGTSEKNIVASVSQSDEFVRYDHNLYGLADKNYGKDYVRIVKHAPHHTFEERFEQYGQFVADNRRHPYQHGADFESTLSRWRDNVLSGKILVSAKCVDRLKDLIARTSHLPQNGREYTFLRNCDLLRDFVEERGVLPTSHSDNSLYHWFAKTVTAYRRYDDNRTRYFEELLDYLSKKGVDIYGGRRGCSHRHISR